ncbi:MAG: cytochrome c biogenesis protein CcdA [Candidatus Caldarchaeum sp.]
MQIDPSVIGLALGAGVVAFFNPCGFALLPSYVAHYLGRGSSAHAASPERWWERGLHGLALGTAVSAGFFTVFLALGIVISLVGTAIGSYFPWAAVFLGLGLMILGISTLVGRELALALPFQARSDRRGLSFYYFYGIGYAIASCGCTLPIFMIYVVGPALTTSLFTGVLNFLAYASGMTLMMLLLSLTMAYSKGSIDRRLPLRQALIGVSIPIVIVLVLLWTQPQVAASWGAAFSGTNRIFLSVFAAALLVMLFFQIRRWERATRYLNGLLLFAAGLYLIYYQVFEYGLFDFR